MTTYAKLRIIGLLALALVGLVSGVGWAGAVIEVRIDDLTVTYGLRSRCSWRARYWTIRRWSWWARCRMS